jgi:hypothetical protein
MLANTFVVQPDIFLAYPINRAVVAAMNPNMHQVP